MKLAILGAGSIANRVADTIRQIPQIECYAVAARDIDRAKELAKRCGFVKAYGSYEEMLSDPEVQLVYVTTPHSHHYQHMKLCIEHGKHVICEKAFTVNADQAREIARLAKEKGVYVAEAIWTRYMPSRDMINEVLSSGLIGTVNTLTANLSYDIDHVKRIKEPVLAGGALLDIGVYGLNFAFMHFGTDYSRMESSVFMTETGVDGMETITLFYPDGRMAVLTHSVYARSDRKGIFHGDKGYAVVENINNPRSISIYDGEDVLVRHIEVPEQISGYEYQFIEAVRCIQEGKIESKSMPLSESVKVMEEMDKLRSEWQMKYPQDIEAV